MLIQLIFNVEGINPQVIENYDGEDIVLNKELNIVMIKEEFPNLNNYKKSYINYYRWYNITRS